MILNHCVLSTNRGIWVLGGYRGHRVLLVRFLLARGILPLLVLVGLDVLGQMIAPHEPLAARRAREPLLAGVRPKMTLQLVAPGEPLATEQPVTDERSFAGVPPEMRL